MTHIFMTKIILTSILVVASLTGQAALAEPQSAPGIIVSASPLERTTTELAVPVTVLTRDNILRRGASTLGGLLGDQPGISQSSFARGSSRPIIRGLDNNRVRIQENGLATRDVSTLSEDHGVPIDPYSAERVEVIRGPAVLRYGNEAIGGLVSILNNRIPDRLPPGGFEAEIQTEHTIGDKGWQGGGSTNFSVGDFVGHADGFARTTDDYATPQGRQRNSGTRSSGLSLGGSIILDNGYVGLSVTSYNSEYRVPGTQAAANKLSIDMEQIRIGSRLVLDDLNGFISGIRGDVGYSDYTHDEVSHLDGTIGSRFNNDAWESRIELLHAPVGAFEGAFGLQLAQRNLSATGEGGELIAPSDRLLLAGFIFEEWKVAPAITLQFGARIEHVNLQGFGVQPTTFEGVTLPGTVLDNFGSRRNLTFTPFSGSTAAVFDIGNNISLGTSLQYVERAPSLLELFAKGPHEATETFEIGNPGLRNESATSLELSLKRDTGPVTFEAAAFYTSFTDFIFKNQTGFVCGDAFDTCGITNTAGVEDELRQIAYAQRDADFRGLELATSWTFLPLEKGVIGVDGRFDYVQAEFEGGGNVPRIPPLRYGLGVFFESDDIFARISFLRAEEQSDVALNETPTNGYTDVRAEAIYAFQLPSSSQHLEVGIIGTNLLNDDIRNHLSFKKEEVLEPGTSVRFFLRTRF